MAPSSQELEPPQNPGRFSWEVTLVNEMLTSMETFPGIFIATTNLMTHIDRSALRRFDLKVTLRPLRTEQAWSMFQRHAAELALSPPRASLQAPLSRLESLTPGDFAVVARQARLRRLSDADAFLHALKCECDAKEGTHAPIGFVA